MLFKPRNCSNVIQFSARFVSSKYPRPFPRPYKRRLFEESLKPILPDTVQACVGPSIVHQNNLLKDQSYMDVELALSQLVKKWIVSEEYSVIVVCQFLPVNGRTLWLTKNQLRLKGLEFRNYGNKVLKKVFEGTAVQSLEPLLVGSNALLFGKDLKSLKSLIVETDKLNWLTPLAVAVNNRILPMEYVRKLAEYRDIEDVRAETVGILSTQLNELPTSLGRLGGDLVGSLSHLSQKE
ncbi:unnamed protein product [Auanema sp. JU1783]|nr:unnamed protein product [Auanema sp. JU1783]